MSGIGLKRLDAGYITGELNEASPRSTSAKGHQICTLATFFTYFGPCGTLCHRDGPEKDCDP